MSLREKDSSDFDLETFVDLFDTAMTSNNPAVRKAFKNLMMISAIVNSEHPASGLRTGPLRRVVDDIQNLNRRISQLETTSRQSPPNVTIPSGPYINTPWVVTSPNTGTPNPVVSPNTGTPTIWPPGSITCASTSSIEETSKFTMAVLEKLENK